MFIFEDEHDLMRSVEQCIDRAQRQAMDTTNLKREQMVARARAAAFTEALEYLKDYFAARTAPPAPTQQEASEGLDPTSVSMDDLGGNVHAHPSVEGKQNTDPTHSGESTPADGVED